MADDDELRVDLGESSENVTTWAYIEEDGTLVIERYDRSQVAEQAFGSECSTFLRIAPDDKKAVFEILSDSEPYSDQSLLELLEADFDQFLSVKEYFIDNDISFDKSFNPFV